VDVVMRANKEYCGEGGHQWQYNPTVTLQTTKEREENEH
jgi:hypothetical protein